MGPVKISIIIPVFNVENYLKQCLESVINQTLQEIEIICVNDGSTDYSLQILEDYAKKDERIRIITKENGGISSARNKGLEYVTGEYLGIVDSDDWIELDMFEKLYQNAKLHDSDMVMCPAHLYDENTQELKCDLPYFTLACFDESFDGRVFSHLETKDFLFRISVTPWNKIYKSEFIKELGVSFPEGLDFDDNPFFYKTYLNAGRVSLVRDYLYFYRINRSGSFITTGNKRYFDIVKMYDLVENIIQETGNEEAYMAKFFNVRVENIITYYNRVDEIYRKEFFEIIKNNFQTLNQVYVNYLDDHNKRKYENVFSSESYREYELNQKNDDLTAVHEEELQKWKDRFHSQEQKLQSLKKELEELIHTKQLIDEITTSNSWKLTKPLRRMGNLLRNKIR